MRDENSNFYVILSPAERDEESLCGSEYLEILRPLCSLRMTVGGAE